MESVSSRSPGERVEATAAANSVVFVGRMRSEEAGSVADLFAKFDSSDLPVLGGLRRRQMYSYYDLHLNVLDFDGEPDAQRIEELKSDPRVAEHQRRLNDIVSPLRPDTWCGMSDSAATPFYLWHGRRWQAGDVIDAHSTIVVNRMDAESSPEVARLFADLDSTDFPSRMGTRRRQLFTHHGVYFHIQDFPVADGDEVIAGAWRAQDPRFIHICQELDPHMRLYDPDTWRSTADQIATRFYHWERTP